MTNNTDFVKITLVAFLFLFPIFVSTNAQENETLKDTLKLDDIVVTGTKTAINRNNVPLTVSVITQKQIEESSESALLPVLSEQVPGIFVTERGVTGFGVSAGSAGAINIRGIGGSPNTETLVLLNGNPQFMGLMGHPLPDAYAASDVEKVEIIRGPASTLYGTNAMGGTINIITKQQKEEGYKANIRTMYGSFATQKYMVNSGYKKDDFNIFASYNHDQTNGHRDSSDFLLNNGYIQMGYDFSSHLNMNADFSLAKFNANDPGQEGKKAGDEIDITRGMGAIAVSNEFEKTKGSVRFFFNYGIHDITNGFHSNDKNYGLVIYQSLNLFTGNTITFGTDFKEYGGIAKNVKAMNGRGIVLGDTTVREIAGYGYIQQSIFNKLILNAGLRIEHSSVYGSEPVPSAGLAYHLSSTTILKASASKGFRSPSIRELYLPIPGIPKPNTNLKPERMVNYEGSILQELLDNRLSVELTAYMAKGENLIKPVNGTLQNTGSFSNKGVEFAGNYKPLNNLSFQLNYSYISMKDPIIATPEQQFFVSGTYRWNRLLVNLSIQNIDNLYTQIIPSREKQNYTLLNTRISYVINNYIDVFAKGENLTNQKYYINYGYPMPGFISFVGINLHY